MPGYFKLKRPFATKTEKLPEGVMKSWAQMFKRLEDQTILSLNAARQLKKILKECTLLEEKKEKEKDSDKKEKISQKIEKKKDELTTKYGELSCNAVAMDFAKNKDMTESFIEYLGKDNAEIIEQVVKLTQNMLDEYSKMIDAAKS